jgi:HPt (histidine-containing phosphotransfer) domain-containing protein/CheY-like chemotaxis protein
VSSVPSEADFVNLLEQLAEIRASLNGLVGTIDGLNSTSLNEIQNRHAQLARHSADALREVINEILDFSKIEAPKVEIERVELDLQNNIRVLIAEPDPAHRRIVAEQLNSYSPSSMVVDCGNLIEAMRNAIDTNTPFAVVMLPFAGEIGFALRQAIAADAKLNNAQFVAVLDINDHTSAAIAAEEGFVACLHRPFTQSKIVDAVTHALGLKEPERAESAAAPDATTTVVPAVVEEPTPSAPAAPTTPVSAVVEIPVPPAPVVVPIPAPIVVNEPVPSPVAVETTAAPVVINEPAPSPVTAETAAAPVVINEPAPSPVVAETTTASVAVNESVPSPVVAETTAAPVVAHEPAATPVAAPSTLFSKKVDEPVQAPTPAPPRPPPTVKAPHPPIDVDNLLSRCMQDPDFARRTLEKFQIRALEDIEKLQKIAQQGDTAQIKRIANNLKAVSAHVAADSLRDIAFEIEQLSMAADLEKIVGQLKRLNDEAQRCAAFIPSAIQQLTQAAEKAKGR